MTIEDFVRLVRDELGLDVAADGLDAAFTEVPGWNSVHLLRLVALLERETGHAVSVPDVLAAPTLGSVYKLAVAA
jgi:acyl carrier protein